MSLPMPPLYHWSRAENRPGIIRRGLKTTTPTGVPIGPRIPGYNAREIDEDASVHAVCLGTSPSHAWSLCGAIWGKRGQEWDLWQVTLDEDDCVHILPFFGYRMEEIRVSNPIPKSRVWHVATRTIGARRWSSG